MAQKRLSALTSAELSLQGDSSCALVSVFSSSCVANTNLPLSSWSEQLAAVGISEQGTC